MGMQIIIWLSQNLIGKEDKNITSKLSIYEEKIDEWKGQSCFFNNNKNVGFPLCHQGI
jgi:hypothetical protein